MGLRVVIVLIVYTRASRLWCRMSTLISILLRLEGIRVASGPDGLLAGLRLGQVLIDMSTVSPAVSRGLAGKVRERAPRWSTRPCRAASSPCSRASCR